MAEISTDCWALNQALELEQEGYDFYQRMAGSVTDAACKDTFASLADDERHHADLITQQINQIETCGIFVRLPGVEPVDIDIDVRLYAPSMDTNKDLGEKATEIQAMHIALDTEIRTYNMYRHAAANTEDEAGQEMYRWLAAAELTHFNLLMANYQAMTGLGYI